MADAPTEKRGPFAGLHRNVVALGATSLLTDISSEMLVPILPLFVTATLHASVASLGVIEGVAECVASTLRLVSGRLADRASRRKPFVLLGYGLSGLAKPAMALVQSWSGVLGLRFADRVGKALRSPPRDALIADSTADADLGRAFGLHRAMDTMGAAIGPLLGWWLLSRWHGDGVEAYRRIFLLSGIPALLALFVIVFFVRTPKESRPRAAALPRWSVPRGPFRRFLCVDVAFQLGNSSMAFALLRTQDVGWSAGQVSLVYLAYNVLYAALAYPFGGLSDRVGRRPLLLAGYLLYAIAYGVFAIVPTRAGALAGFLVLAVHSALIEGQGKALIADLVPRESRASAYGVSASLAGLALLPASIVAGALWDRAGAAAPFVLGAALSLVAAGLLAVLLPPGRGGERAHA
ncbi:MAG: MFS transporter [Candidatus Eisenbacteria bacterium]|uniref:MFS transporter n=1 Tax=Eiseniibacteriota bacterium TaxID=2212470 RepID=A0A933SDT7_UNCEI|nr:MFS transporter [Candidatus Eisenbacteria bacterium]